MNSPQGQATHCEGGLAPPVRDFNMAKFDLRTVGITSGTTRYRVAASATRGYVGEPVQFSNPTRGSGTTSVNTVTICADNDPVIGTDEFVGICAQDFVDSSGGVTGTVIAQYTDVEVPIPYATKIRGKAETKADIDTQSELTGVLGDYTEFALTSSTFTIKSTAAAETGGLMIVDGNLTKGELDVFVDPRVMRKAVS